MLTEMPPFFRLLYTTPYCRWSSSPTPYQPNWDSIPHVLFEVSLKRVPFYPCFLLALNETLCPLVPLVLYLCSLSSPIHFTMKMEVARYSETLFYPTVSLRSIITQKTVTWTELVLNMVQWWMGIYSKGDQFSSAITLNLSNTRVPIKCSRNILYKGVG
jgi:hypothetical protein